MKTIVVRKLAIDKGLLPSLGLPHDGQEKLILDIRNRLGEFKYELREEPDHSVRRVIGRLKKTS